MGPERETFAAGSWSGTYAFSKVYCLTFPDPARATSLDTGLLNGNAVGLARANYDDRTAVYVVNSTIPAGRTPADEFARLLANERTLEARIRDAGGRFEVSTSGQDAAPVIALRIENVVEDGPEGSFPLQRPIVGRAPGKAPLSMSSHRLFVRGPDRIEIAVLGAPDPSNAADTTDALWKRIDARATATLDALQSCSSRFPLRTP